MYTSFFLFIIIITYCIRTRKTQSKLLAGAVVKKRTLDKNTNNISKKQKKECTESNESTNKSAGLVLCIDNITNKFVNINTNYIFINLLILVKIYIIRSEFALK